MRKKLIALVAVLAVGIAAFAAGRFSSKYAAATKIGVHRTYRLGPSASSTFVPLDTIVPLGANAIGEQAALDGATIAVTSFRCGIQSFGGETGNLQYPTPVVDYPDKGTEFCRVDLSVEALGSGPVSIDAFSLALFATNGDSVGSDQGATNDYMSSSQYLFAQYASPGTGNNLPFLFDLPSTEQPAYLAISAPNSVVGYFSLVD